MALFQRIRSTRAQGEPEHQPAVSPGMRSASDALRQQREAFGLDLAQVAAGLKIKPAYLAAIEEGRTDLLPGAAYAVGFVRAYSTYLGLDSAEILRRFKYETAGFDAKPDLAFPVPLGERSMPGGGMLLTALALTVCGYATWYYLSAAERTHPERVSAVPATLLPAEVERPIPNAALTPAAAAPSSPHPVGPPGAKSGPNPGQRTVASEPAAQVPASRPAPAASDTAKAGPALAGTASPPPVAAASVMSAMPPAAGVPAVPPPPAPATTATPAPATGFAGPTAQNPMAALAAPAAAQGQSPHAYGGTEGPSRIVLHATADSWIQIRAADRTVLFTGLLKPGDSYRVPDQPGLSMRAGNAGGLELSVDGKPARAVGPTGAVRNVTLDPQSLVADGAVND
ncbi:MAG TPA: RodZ domain-containing protein [Stellaceae bacterium]|jgi:cytoskeleton protein RodZ|nr:RodZ domain-containing protein [Stellaceae bacterium]